MAAKAVLGISPGTRIIGIAVIHKGELVEWRVKTFKEAWSREKRLAIVSTIRKLCEYHNIGTIAVKKVDPLRTSPQLDKLLRSVSKQAKRYGIRFHEYSLSELDYNIQTGKRQTKDDLVEHVASKHPELKHEYVQERNSRKDYHTKMFEAVAIAEFENKTSM